MPPTPQQDPPLSQSPILLFDGVCNVCDAIVRFILRHDRKRRFRFASMQSEPGQRLLRDHGFSTERFDTVVLLWQGKAEVASSAAFQVARLLGPPWSLASAFSWLPTSLTDALYRAFARSRYRLFGRRDQCRIPTPEERQRFLV